MNITATVTTTSKTDRWGYETFHYTIQLSNGVTAKRQAKGGTAFVGFDLRMPEKTSATKNLPTLLRKYKTQEHYVIVDLEKESVIVCGFTNP